MSNQPNNASERPSTSTDPLQEVWNSFEVRDTNLHDLTLLVDGRELYASQKVLAHHSTTFYDLLDFDSMVKCEPNTTRSCRTYPIGRTKYDDFRCFLALLYNHVNVLTITNYLELADLSKRFNSYKCQEEVEKFIIAQRFSADKNLDYAQTYDFNELERAAYNGFTNAYDLLDLEKSAYYEKFDEQTKHKITEKIVALSGNREFDEILLSEGDLQIIIGGVLWEAKFARNDRSLEATIECKLIDATNPWMCKVTMECREAGSFQYKMGDTQTVSANRRNIVFKCCGDGKCGTPRHFDIRIRIYPMSGIFKERSSKFAHNCRNITDVVLLVEDQRFHVMKQFLAHHSPFFYSLFYGSFQERTQDEVPLGGITKDEFEKFLQFLYNPSRVIKKENVDTILRLSDMYNVKILLQKCEEYLKIAEINDVEKIARSLKYNFKSEQVVSKYKNSEGLQQFSEQQGFHELPDGTIGQIAKRLLKKK